MDRERKHVHFIFYAFPPGDGFGDYPAVFEYLAVESRNGYHIYLGFRDWRNGASGVTPPHWREWGVSGLQPWATTVGTTVGLTIRSWWSGRVGRMIFERNDG